MVPVENTFNYRQAQSLSICMIGIQAVVDFKNSVVLFGVDSDSIVLDAVTADVVFGTAGDVDAAFAGWVQVFDGIAYKV